MASEAAAIMSKNPNPSLLDTSNQLEQAQGPPPAKKKRSLPGTPDPDAEVIALSPRTLLATNRFVCEICGKGFQRDQNLQLHRRGHNLPWKLKQSNGGANRRKRVYVCPEKSCVHHNPSRALGDLTGIKKHFCRKHGEKKWKCDKCSKRYAVQSDWKAHGKTCGTREYRCDCGTLFSRRDSFITHRAFCDALAQETARIHHHQYQIQIQILQNNNNNNNLSLFGGAAAGGDADQLIMPPSSCTTIAAAAAGMAVPFDAQLGWLYYGGNSASGSCSELLTSTAASKDSPSLFSVQQQHKPAAVADMSATALLQKAAQIGAVVTSNNSNSISSSCTSTTTTPSQVLLDGLLFAQHHNATSSSLANLQPYLNKGREEETRDFLGVALCSPSLHGWI